MRFLPCLVVLIIPGASAAFRSIPKQSHSLDAARQPSGEMRRAGDDHLAPFEELDGPGEQRSQL